jgi:two-component system sensor histidine kinase KdpD
MKLGLKNSSPAELYYEDLAKARMPSALLASISHDLRTPLASILGSATALKIRRSSLDESSQRELIDIIEEEAERLDRFISGLLDMTRLDAGQIRPRREYVFPSEVVGSAIHRARKLLGRHKLEVSVDPRLPMVMVDPLLLEQVLFNILDNAAKYAPEGTTIRLCGQYVSGCMSIQITDEGEGIPDAELKRVFETFYRVRSSARQCAGTGLGLAICRGFVEAMGGTISAANRSDGGGAIFCVTLPVCDALTELQPQLD